MSARDYACPECLETARQVNLRSVPPMMRCLRCRCEYVTATREVIKTGEKQVHAMPKHGILGIPQKAGLAAEAETDDKWDRRGCGLAREVASWSSCQRDNVGAVVLSEARDVVATGFNDTAPGHVNCGDGGCPRVARALAGDVVPGQAYLDEDECLHAEDNALQRAGLAARGATLYVTRTPCGTCVRRAKTAGVVRIVVARPL